MSARNLLEAIFDSADGKTVVVQKLTGIREVKMPTKKMQARAKIELPLDEEFAGHMIAFAMNAQHPDDMAPFIVWIRRGDVDAMVADHAKAKEKP